MRIPRSALSIGLVLAACGGRAADGPAGEAPAAPPGSVDGEQAVPPASGGGGSPLPASPDGIEMSSRIYRRPTADGLGDFSVALRWEIDEDMFPESRTTTAAILEETAAGELLLRAAEPPPNAALVANDLTDRDGFAVAYVVAFVDGDGNQRLDCLNPGECVDVQVGASRNTVVVYAARPWPTDGDGMFGAQGVRPDVGWSLVNLAYGGLRSRPSIRAWTAGASIELAIIGDFRARSVEERRSVMPDLD